MSEQMIPASKVHGLMLKGWEFGWDAHEAYVRCAAALEDSDAGVTEGPCLKQQSPAPASACTCRSWDGSHDGDCDIFTEPVEGVDFAILTEGDVALINHAVTAGAEEMDFSEFAQFASPTPSEYLRGFRDALAEFASLVATHPYVTSTPALSDERPHTNEEKCAKGHDWQAQKTIGPAYEECSKCELRREAGE